MQSSSNKDLIKKIVKSQREGKIVIFTNGCFDILHRGHVEYLNEAKQLGDILVVGLNSDDSVRRLKGRQRPYQNEKDRLVILNALKMVDFVLIFSEDTPIELIRELKPNILVKGGDYNFSSIVGAKEVEGWGGSVKIISFRKGYGTSQLVEKILKS